MAPEAEEGGTAQRTILGLTTGGGISYHLTPSASVDWSLRYTFGNLDQPACPGSSDTVRTCATSTRASLGMTWYLLSR